MADELRAARERAIAGVVEDLEQMLAEAKAGRLLCYCAVYTGNTKVGWCGKPYDRYAIAGYLEAVKLKYLSR